MSSGGQSLFSSFPFSHTLISLPTPAWSSTLPPHHHLFIDYGGKMSFNEIQGKKKNH